MADGYLAIRPVSPYVYIVAGVLGMVAVEAVLFWGVWPFVFMAPIVVGILCALSHGVLWRSRMAVS